MPAQLQVMLWSQKNPQEPSPGPRSWEPLIWETQNQTQTLQLHEARLGLRQEQWGTWGTENVVGLCLGEEEGKLFP